MYIIIIIAMVLGSVYFTKLLLKKFNINRWIVGGTAPLVLIIPSLLFDNINSIVWSILLLIFCVMCIMFFEITRTKLENNEIKGMVNYNKNK
jgi:hypothetical protein